MIKVKAPQLECLSLCKSILELGDTEVSNESIKHLCKGEWPLMDLQISRKYFNLGCNTSVTPKCLIYLKEAIWKLKKLRTSFTKVLCIHYLASVVR